MPEKKPLSLCLRILKLLLQKEDTDWLVQKSYDRISGGYDETWTHHMRNLTCEMIERLDIQPGQTAIDLTCGTGYATGLIASKTKAAAVGVDQSGGMLEQARQNYPDCLFTQADILNYLKAVPSDSVDLVTCCWGLGYSKPLQVLRQICRILKKGGKVGIIDNTLFSLREVMYCSTLAFMERPETLEHLMKFRFLMGKRHLALWMRLAGFEVRDVWGAGKSYEVQSGREAIERLKATGAAAGFEYAAASDASEAVYGRFAEILEQKYKKDGRIQIVHRYAGGIGIK